MTCDPNRSRRREEERRREKKREEERRNLCDLLCHRSSYFFSFRVPNCPLLDLIF